MPTRKTRFGTRMSGPSRRSGSRSCSGKCRRRLPSGDMTALNALAAELENSAWRIDRPEMLISQIAVARSNAARQQGLGELKRTADCLNAMHAALDVDGGRRVRAQWDAVVCDLGTIRRSVAASGSRRRAGLVARTG